MQNWNSLLLAFSANANRPSHPAILNLTDTRWEFRKTFKKMLLKHQKGCFKLCVRHYHFFCQRGRLPFSGLTWRALGKTRPKAVDFLVIENLFSGKVTSNLNCLGYENNILRISRLYWLFVLLKLVSKWCKYQWTLLIRLRPVRQMMRYLVDFKAGSLWEGGCLDMEAGGSSFECTLTA